MEKSIILAAGRETSANTLETAKIDDIFAALNPSSFSLNHSKQYDKTYFTLNYKDGQKDMHLSIGVSTKLDIPAGTPEAQAGWLCKNAIVYTGTQNAAGETTNRWFSFGPEGVMSEPISFAKLSAALKVAPAQAAKALASA